MYKKSLFAIAALAVLSNSSLATEQLGDVVITAKSNKGVFDTAGSFNVITQQQIKEAHATSIQDLLSKTAGVSLLTNGSGRQELSLRGLDGNFTMVLIDGKEVSNIDRQITNGDFGFAMISLDMIEKIEIGKGPMSTLYGSGALGGVINIITKKPTDKLSGGVDFVFGTPSGKGGNEQNVSANLRGKVNDTFSFVLSGSNKNSAIIPNKEDSTETDFEGREITSVNMDGIITIDDTQQVTLSYLQSSDDRDEVGKEKYYENDNKQYTINYSKYFENVILDMKAYRTQTDSHTTFSNGFKHELVDDTFNIESKIDMFENHFVVLGAEAKKYDYKQTKDSSASPDFDKDATQKSFYIQDDIDLKDDLTLTLGLRYDNHENYDSEVSPKAYLMYKLSENSRIKGGYAEGYLAPTISQGTSEYQAIRNPAGPVNLIFNGNDDLKAQTGKTYELAYEYQKDNFGLKTTVFYNDIKNFIDSVKLSQVMFTSTYEYQNINNVNTKGIEVELSQVDLLQDLDFNMAYTYLSTENEDTNKELNMRPKHKINAQLSYLLPYDVNSFLKYELYGTQYNVEEDVQLGSYSTFDLGFTKQLSKNFSTKVGVNNLFNKEINSESDGYGFQIRPRLFYVGLSYKF